MLNTEFAPWPSYDDNEAQIAADVVKSNRVNYWTGEHGRLFEQEFAEYVGCQHAIALANGTLALELALQAMGIGQGDEVIVTSRTFLASASSIITCGAKPVFADVERDTQNISADTIADKVTDKTKAIMCVHLAGLPCDMDPIMELAKQHDLMVIEDCAQAHGAQYKGRHVGTIGDVGAWSFCQDKIMTTAGEGGMVTTNNESLWKAMWSLKDHGKDYDAVYHQQHPPGFRWLHHRFGSNYRMTEIQSAIGRYQLTQLDDWVAKRTRNAEQLNRIVAKHACVSPLRVDEGVKPAWYKFYCFVDEQQLAAGWSRDRIVQAVSETGVPCMQGSCSEVYLEKAFDGHPSKPTKRLENAQHLGNNSIMMLVHPTLSSEQISAACKALDEVLSKAGV